MIGLTGLSPLVAALTSYLTRTRRTGSNLVMISRLYANNFRCLVAFETGFESFGVICGPNGAGKSSVFDVIRLIRDLATGDSYLGGDGARDIARLEFTNWLDSTIQEFELSMMADGHSFDYVLHIEQAASDKKPRIVRERAVCDKRELFDRDLDGVRFQKSSGVQSGFPLDWRQAALASIQPAGGRREIEILQQAISKLLILRPSPRSMEKESKGESMRPDLALSNLTSWYRSLSQEQDWTDALRELLQEVWPDFKSFRLVDVGLNAKALQLRFEGSKSGEAGALFFDHLSDGEKALVGLYMVRAALDTGAAQTVLIDEPDNYVGLPELQPWVLSLRELLDENHQAIIISHHPEILSNAGEDFGRYLWRDNHTSPTRIGPLKTPAGISSAEAMARGWVHA
jgi:predicted ATPase